MKLSFLRNFALVGVINLLFLNAALADEVTPRLQQRGRELLEEAYEADREGKTQRAFDLYRESFDVYPSFDVAGNLGMTEMDFGLYADAANHLSYCLRNYPTAESREMKTEVEARFKEAKKHVGAMAIAVDVDGASILIDGEQIGTSPLPAPYFVKPGSYRVRAEKAGRGAQSTIEVGAKEEAQVELPLAEGVLKQTQPKRDQPAKPVYSPYRLPVSASVAGLGVVGLGVGVGFIVHSGAQRGTVEELSADLADDDAICTGPSPDPRCTEIDETAREAQQAKGIAVSGLVAGGALLAGSVLLYFLWPESTKSTALESMTPSVAYDDVLETWQFGLTGGF